VLVVVVIVSGMAVAVVQIVHVAVVLHSFVSAPGAVLVGVFVICGLVLSPGIIGVDRWSVFGSDRHCLFLVPSSLLLTCTARPFVDCTAFLGQKLYAAKRAGRKSGSRGSGFWSWKLLQQSWLSIWETDQRPLRYRLTQ
jgi:hypothetical protein